MDEELCTRHSSVVCDVRLPNKENDESPNDCDVDGVC